VFDLTEANAFGELVAPYRRELLAHCYRMLGSVDDAEDAVQDTLARAWRGRRTFIEAISFRAWLYRIATNACLDAIEGRRRVGAARAERGLRIEPFPDRLLAEPDRADAGPEARFDTRESISLAFLTVLQVLPPRQRAVLLLRDVLSMRAAEVAALLDVSVPAVNSALQRARTTIRGRYTAPNDPVPAGASDEVRSLLDRYVHAWEAADIATLVGLLRDDAVLAMPPRASVIGARAIGDFLGSTFFPERGPIRLVPTSANGSPAFVGYVRRRPDGPFEAAALLVLGLARSPATGAIGIGRIDAFGDPRQLRQFDVPSTLHD
jgi:RNA polymerase sigma-70 factor, ECF subfamily